METRFVQCPDCEGRGEVQVGTAWIREYGHAPDHDAIMDKCDTCNGTGLAETEVWPVECGDDETDLAARYFVEGELLAPLPEREGV